MSHLLSVRALWLKWRMSWCRGSGWISATSSSSSSTIFIGVFCRNPQVWQLALHQSQGITEDVSSYHHSFKSSPLPPPPHNLTFIHTLIQNIEQSRSHPLCSCMQVSLCHVLVIGGEDGKRKIRVGDEQRWNWFSKACMLQQTDASRKLFGDMILKMMNDPKSTEASQLHNSDSKVLTA